MLAELLLWPPAERWLRSHSFLSNIDTHWALSSLDVVSPMAAPTDTLAWLTTFGGVQRPWFWICAMAWNVLIWAFAAAVFWATLRTFDLYMERMPETSRMGVVARRRRVAARRLTRTVSVSR
jgi:hypothetical protein